MVEKRKTSKTASGTAGRQVCGIIRPISGTAEYSASHWREVHEIVENAADMANFDLRLVSDSDAANVILSGIIRNIYEDPIIICDVSSKNPNVMFELGLRMAFEKPVVIIADDTTDFSFDISPVRHLKYPSTLRYSKMLTFRDDLSATIKGTLEQSQSPDYRGYLQQFGPIHVSGLETQNIAFDSIGQELVEIKRAVQSLQSRRPRTIRQSSPIPEIKYTLEARLTSDDAEKLEDAIDDLESYISYFTDLSEGLYEIRIREYPHNLRKHPDDRKKLDDLLVAHNITLS